MANCRSVVKHYEKMNVQQLGDLWNHFNRKGPTVDVLREILMYYIHHKYFPPVMQKTCDTLLASVDLKHVSKKQKNIIFQIMEEVSVYLESSIIEQVTFASDKNNHTSLVNCILVGGLIPLLDEVTVEKLLSFLKKSEVPVEERGKLLLCLLVIHGTYPTLISSENLSRLGNLMETWFTPVQSKPVASSVSLFGRSDSSAATEVDGSCAGEVHTVLTLANNFSDNHLMSIHCFSTIREWLGKQMIHKNRKLTESLREYCNLVVEQCFRPARKEHDIALQKAVLCEVLDIMNQLVQMDTSNGPHCLKIVKRIQNNIKENFKGDYRDIHVFVRVLSFLLNFGESTGYNSQLVCEYFLQDMVYRSYTSGLAATDTILFLLENRNKLIALQEPLLQRFFPNILKIIACHPCVVIEEFIELLPDFISPSTAVEVFHSILDLPLLAATLCLHQAPMLAQADSAGSMDTEWATLLRRARSIEFQHVFNYMMRIETGQEIALSKMPAYMKLLHKISNHSLVITCCQIVSLLLECYYDVIEKWKDVSCIAPVVLDMFNRLQVLYDSPGYIPAVHRCLLLHFKQLFKACPGLIFSIPSEIVEYVSATKNYDAFPQLYIHIIYVIGEHSTSADWDTHNRLQLIQYYEVIECTIYQILAQFATSESVCFELLNVASSTLAKLATRCQDQIPRAVLCLNKIRMQFSSTSFNHHELIIRDRIEELLCVLQNPNVANTVWSVQSSNTSVTSFVQVLSHVTDS
ncbi:Uncharacterized protein GBIM_15189 [Gryllus bimaculatus]|nr:Uncharacterized protein GBIM_15189 [Gryllus bimaculatus]